MWSLLISPASSWSAMWPAILPSPLRLFLASLLFPSDTSQNTLQFHLRHEHAVSATNHIVFADVPGNSPLLAAVPTPFVVNTAPIRTHRPSSLSAHSKAVDRSRQHAQSSLLDWWGEEVQGPDVESRESLLTLAKMTFDAYLEPSDKEWYEPDPQWNKVSPFLSYELRVVNMTAIPRHIHLAGNLMRTAFEGIYSCPQIIQLSLYLSKALRLVGSSEVEARRCKKINLMIIYCFRAVVPG